MDLNYKEIGARIAAKRRALGLKQAQVAEIADLSDNYLSNIERGHSVTSLETLAGICKALDMTFDEVLLGAQNRKAGIPDEKTLAQKLALLDEKDRELVFAFTDMLIGRSGRK